MSSHEYQITVFSPEGKLHQVEYAIKAIKLSGLTSVGVRGKDSVVVITQKKVEDSLIESESVSNLVRITPSIGCLITGRESDGKAWATRLRQEAFDFLKENGTPISIDTLAMRAGDLAQLYTQKFSIRAYAAELILYSVDSLLGPQLFKIDPAGHFYGYFAVSAGLKEQEAMNFLEKELGKKENFSSLNLNQTIRLAIETLQQTIGQDFKSGDIEISYVDSGSMTYKKLNENEIDHNLKIVQKFE